MKTVDEFEAFLAAQPLRQLPAEWQRQVCDAASIGSATEAARRRNSGLITLFRPRHAWSALAAVWLGLALLYFDTPPAPIYAGPLPRSTIAQLEQQLVRRQVETVALLAYLDFTHLPPDAKPNPPTSFSPSVL